VNIELRVACQGALGADHNHGYFHATRSCLQRHDKPIASYSDEAGVFLVNAKSPKTGDG
jgi:hypothetical protein